MAITLLIVALSCLVTFGLNHDVQLTADISSLSSPTPPPGDTPLWVLPAAHSPGSASAGLVPEGSDPGWDPSPPQTTVPAANPAGLSTASLDLSALASTVDPAVVDINTQLGAPNAQAAGTGIVVDSSGVVLTNNHVISGATSITVTDIGTGQTYPATVLGYDRTHDVAVLQLQNVSGLPTAQIGDSSTVAVGDAIAAIGNAGGRGGTPAITAGTVTALDQTVTVSDPNMGNTEQLAGLIQVAADVQPGDSGGPLVNSAGQVMGMDTAGSAGAPGQSGSLGGQGLAIPINDAMAISQQIQAGSASPTIHLGPTGILGITVQTPTAAPGPTRRGRFRTRHHLIAPTVPGALVTGTLPGSPAEQSGLTSGDIIVSLDATPVDSAITLTTLLTAHHPGDSVQLTWVDPTGQQHTATVQLATGPPN